MASRIMNPERLEWRKVKADEAKNSEHKMEDSATRDSKVRV